MVFIFLLHTLFFSFFSNALSPCLKEVNTFCKDVRHGDGRIGKCLKENNDSMSFECAIYAMKMRDKRKSVKEACYGDIKNVCKDITPGNGRVFKCLKDKSNLVSERCKVEMIQITELFNNK